MFTAVDIFLSPVPTNTAARSGMPCGRLQSAESHPPLTRGHTFTLNKQPIIQLILLTDTPRSSHHPFSTLTRSIPCPGFAKDGPRYASS